MKRAGRIVAVSSPPGPNEVAASGHVTVELEPGAACARCASGHGCGAALFAPAGEPLRLTCTLHATSPGGTLPPGTRVEVELHGEGARWLLPVAFAYALPTAGLLAGAFAPEPWTPFAAVAGLVGGVLAGRVANARLASAGAGPCRPVARTSTIHDPRLSTGD